MLDGYEQKSFDLQRGKASHMKRQKSNPTMQNCVKASTNKKSVRQTSSQGLSLHHSQSYLDTDPFANRPERESRIKLKRSPSSRSEQTRSHALRADNDAERNFESEPSSPLVHLPLRKQLSRSLRLGNLTSRISSVNPLPRIEPSQGSRLMFGNISSSASTRVSQGIERGRNYNDTSDTVHGGNTGSSQDGMKSDAQTYTARYRAVSDVSSTTCPPALRPSTSIPDYRAIKIAYRRTAAARTRPDKSQSARTSLQSTKPRGATFWRDGGASSVRESFRSALTNGSSAVERSGTERSSFLSQRSSATDYDNPNGHWSKIRNEEMSVEDCITMYAEGFMDGPADEAVPASLHPSLPYSSLELRRDSETLPGNSLQSLGGPEAVPKPFAATSYEHTRSSAQIIAGQFDETDSQPQPQIEPSMLRDRYGFKKETQYIKPGEYDAWNATYTPYLERRRNKWIELMKHHKLSIDSPSRFPPKSEKVKRYIRKGIPPEWRGAAWFWYAGGPDRLTKYPGQYMRLVEQAENGNINESDKEHIERDLHRTFPDNIHFKPDPTTVNSNGGHQNVPLPLSNSATVSHHYHVSTTETAMIISLRRTLQAFAIHNPKIGYCQSLNFLAGQLLLFLSISSANIEEKAFHLLCVLTSEYLPGTHGIALEGANVDIGVLMGLLQETMPALWAKMDDRPGTARKEATGARTAGKSMQVATMAAMPTVSLATTAWFMSCFVSTLPVETCCRVWDSLFYEGSKTLFRVALGIFRLGEPEIRRMSDPMEVFQLVQTLPRKLIDANLVMEASFRKANRGMGLLSQDVVEKRRRERRALYADERARLLVSPTTPSTPPGEAQPKAISERKLSRTFSRARLRRKKSQKGA